jgi:hypothetical protein
MRRLLVPALLLLVAPAPAHARVELGLSGGGELRSFEEQVGRRPTVFGFFTYFKHSPEYAFEAAERTGARLMLHVGTSGGYGEPGVISPRGIAAGRGDAWLLALNRRLGEWGRRSHVRLMAEMNQANNAYAPFDAAGNWRGPSHSSRAFVAAWRRTTLILRGGQVGVINLRLRALRLPTLRGVRNEDVLPRPQVEMMWVPQTRGSPDIPANMPHRFWPGGRYVDWVGTDFFSRYPRFDWLSDFYARFARKPFVFGEWSMWGRDDPVFVRAFFRWVRARPRVKLLMYYQGTEPDAPFRIQRYPLARAELRRQLARLP